MLGWISNKLGRDHELERQLRSPKALQKYMAALSVQRPDQALRVISALFDSAASLQLPAARLVEVLDTCDHYAQPLCLVLYDSLLENPPKQVISEPTWNTLCTYYRARERGYRACLPKLETTLPGNEHSYTTAVIFACRAANALAKRCMLLGMTYADPAEEVWTQLAAMVADCRVAAQALALTKLYTEDIEQTSLQRELLVTLLFQAAPIANLLPAQHHALDLLLRRHAQHFEMRDRYDREARPFVLENATHCRPARWLPGRREHAGLKFIGPGFAGTELLRERERASSTRRVPHFVESSGSTFTLYRDLLDRLIEHWSLAPPARRHPRESRAGKIVVARDLAHIHRLLGFSELARSGHSLTGEHRSEYALENILRDREAAHRTPLAMPPPLPTAAAALASLDSFEQALGTDATAAWTLVDSSEEGLGAETVIRGPRLTVGLLIAFRQSDGIDWQLATIRRLSRGDGGRIRVGLATMEGRPWPVRLSLDRAASPAEPSLGPALHYDAIKLVAGTTELLVPPGILGPGWRCRLTEQRRWDLIEVNPKSESGLDFERARYSVVQGFKAA